MTLGLGSIVSVVIGHDHGRPVCRPAVVMQSLADVGGGLDLHVLLSPRDVSLNANDARRKNSITAHAYGLSLFLANADEGDKIGQWRPLPPSSLETS